MNGYITLDCRDGVHGACETCSCRCHREALSEALRPLASAVLSHLDSDHNVGINRSELHESSESRED